MKVQIIADTHGSNILLQNNVDAIFLLGDNSGGLDTPKTNMRR